MTGKKDGGISEHLEKLEAGTLPVGIENGATPVEHNLEAPQKVKRRITTGPSSYVPK